MEATPNIAATGQGVENATPICRKSRRRKQLRARDISTITRSEIVREFIARESYEATAREMNTPGLNAKTVAEVIDLYLLRKPPAPAAVLDRRSFGVVDMRRSA